MKRIGIGGDTLGWDDHWLCIERNGQHQRLSPTQYRICRVFLPPCASSPSLGDLAVVAYRSYDSLEQETELSHEGLIRHISTVNARLAGLGIQLCSLHNGYALTLLSESAES